MTCGFCIGDLGLFLVLEVLKLSSWSIDWTFVGEYHGKQGKKEGVNIEATSFNV